SRTGSAHISVSESERNVRSPDIEVTRGDGFGSLPSRTGWHPLLEEAAGGSQEWGPPHLFLAFCIPGLLLYRVLSWLRLLYPLHRFGALRIHEVFDVSGHHESGHSRREEVVQFRRSELLVLVQHDADLHFVLAVFGRDSDRGGLGHGGMLVHVGLDLHGRD